MTKKQWDKHPEFQQELAGLLAHPTMVAALQIIKDRGMLPVKTPAGVDLMHFAALIGARQQGYFESLLNLDSLSKLPAESAPARPPWTSDERLAADRNKPDPDATSAP